MEKETTILYFYCSSPKLNLVVNEMRLPGLWYLTCIRRLQKIILCVFYRNTVCNQDLVTQQTNYLGYHFLPCYRRGPLKKLIGEAHRFELRILTLVENQQHHYYPPVTTPNEYLKSLYLFYILILSRTDLKNAFLVKCRRLHCVHYICTSLTQYMC